MLPNSALAAGISLKSNAFSVIAVRVRTPQLAKDGLYVVVDCPHRDHQALGNLTVPQPLCNQGKDLYLTRRQATLVLTCTRTRPLGRARAPRSRRRRATIAAAGRASRRCRSEEPGVTAPLRRRPRARAQPRKGSPLRPELACPRRFPNELPLVRPRAVQGDLHAEARPPPPPG